MNIFTRHKRILSMILALVMVCGMLPFSAFAAESGRTADTIFFATDRHGESSKLKSLLQAMAYEPGLVVLGGDHVNNTDSGSLASITAEIQSVYPGVQTFYTYAAHDPNVTEDSSNPYAYARTGEVYEGEDYYVYAIDQDHMSSASNASSASSAFKTWAASADASKVIFVMCHMPIHSRRGDNAGGATWMTALNEVGQTHDVVYLWGHNHTGENSADTSVYFVGVGGSLTPQGGSTGTINFTYMNAGYIKNGYGSMVVVNGDCVDVSRYSTSGSVTATYEIERRFAVSHTWEVTEYVAATCTEAGYQTAVCADCGETKTSVIAAAGHDYTTTLVENCVGSFTVYTCGVCGHSYSEQNATETTYDAVSTLTEGESYVIVASNYALTYGSSVGRTSVSVSNGSITSDVTDAMIWTYENGKLYNAANGKYINYSGSSSRKTITFSTSGAAVSYSSNKLKIGSYYLYHSSSSGFSARSSGSTVTLYQVNEGYTITGEHTYESVTVPATCTENGSVTYTCTGCGDSYVEVIAATGSHAYTTETVNATCTTAGSVTYTCTVCGDTVVETIEALGHSYEAAVTTPTCTEAGFTTYTCACGDTYVADETAALGHAYNAVTVPATCTENGSVTYTCVCGDSYVEVIAAAGHSHKAAVTAPTCTEAGFTTYTCACGDTYAADEVAALGHENETVTVEATCTAGGYTANTCVRCGEGSVTGETPALGHDYETVTTAATCTEAGCATHTCVRCADTYVSDQVAALGHSYETVTVAATCTEAGSVTSVCAVCGDSTEETLPALGHSYETVTVAATCTEAGSVTTTCAACGDTSVEVIAALGHDYQVVVTAPTCTENGFTTHTCVCGDSYVSDETAATGHSYTGVESNGYMVYTCACGDSYSEKISSTYTQVGSISSGSRYVITIYSGSTYYALSHSGNQISAVQISVSGGVITSEITEDLLWTYDGSKLSYASNGTTYYLYSSSANNWWGSWFGGSLEISTSNSSTVSFSGTKLKVGSSYLRYSNGALSLNRTAGTAYCFAEE